MKPVDINVEWLDRLERCAGVALDRIVWQTVGKPVEDGVNIIAQLLIQITWEE